MQFTGKNLLLVRDSIGWAISDIQNDIGQCPNVFEYAADIAEWKENIAELEKLLVRVEAGLLKEEQNAKRP